MKKLTSAETLNKILEDKLITPVYQPIVSLANGGIFGYEALSRVLDKSIEVNIEELFHFADQMDKTWELETLCRKRALKNAKHIAGTKKKLLLNVSPNIAYDEKFKEEFTKNQLEKYGLDTHNVIFEITERTAIVNKNAFLSSIEHYRKQHFTIALDDVGSGYSGLSVINDIKPEIMKLDMHLIRNIDIDETKQLLCKAMIDFSKGAGIKVIAEGIETEEELKTVIRLGADFGQGYFLSYPSDSFVNVSPEKIAIVRKHHSEKFIEIFNGSVYPIVGHLSKKGHCFSPDEKTESIYDTLRFNPSITEFTIVENEMAIGFMTKTVLNELFSGRYGYSLNSKKTITELAGNNFLRVNYEMPVEQVSKLAMQRPQERLYDPIVIEYEGKYAGIVTVKDLLDTSTKIKIEIAKHANPLTGLPGNLLIEKEIINRIFGSKPYCITYYDLDNFKAYNDAYGFQSGDLMLALVADILKEQTVKSEFVGHIGGDDFIVICDYHEGEELCKTVISEFSSKVGSLYREEDQKNGYIVSKNRHGVAENFPLASLSIAGISNRTKTYKNLDDFSREIAQVKKNCKKQQGNYFEIV